MDQQAAENSRLAASSENQRRDLEATIERGSYIERSVNFTLVYSVLSASRTMILQSVALINANVDLRDQALIAVHSLHTIMSDMTSAFIDTSRPFDISRWLHMLAIESDNWTKQLQRILSNTRT